MERNTVKSRVGNANYAALILVGSTSTDSAVKEQDIIYMHNMYIHTCQKGEIHVDFLSF